MQRILRPPVRRIGSLARFGLAATVLAVTWGLLHAPAAAQSSSPISTVFVIVFENHNWSEIAGNAGAPYINSLLATSSYARRYSTPPGLHPSTPNYLWMEAGQDFGIGGLSNYTTAQYSQNTTSHLVTQLNGAGISWKTYHEDIDGTACPLVDVNKYTVHHNPFVFFNDVTNNQDPASAYCISHVRPFIELATDLAQNTVARYNFIVPNLCNDMHDCSITTGDNWLAANLPVILNSQAYLNGGAVFVMWDEGTSATSDGPVGMIVLSPAGKGGGYSNAIPYTHSSLLLTLQEIFGVRPLLGDASNATDLSDLFSAFPAVTPSTPTPVDQSSGVGPGTTLQWSSSGGSDAVYLGTSNPPPLVASNIATRSYTPAALSPSTTYYWQVVSATSAGTSAGPVWRFTTGTTGLPNPWTNTDVGVVGVTGSATFATGTFTIKGAGADVWGSTDAFQFMYQPLVGDGQITTRVASLQNTNAYAKAGVMLRDTTAGNSDHVILDVKPGGGVEFMQRNTPGGSTTYLAGTTVPLPVWLRLSRSGATVTASVSRDGITWSTIGNASTTLPATALAGLPVTSHTTTALATATFDNTSVVAITNPAPPPPPPAPSAPASPTPADGATGVATNPALTWTASGATSYDIAFGATNPPPSAATGLTAASYSPQGMTAGTKYYWQVVARSSSGTTAGPVWSFSTAASSPPSTGGLPVPWQNRDIGSVGIAGSASFANGVFTVKGAGADVWGSTDSFQFVYQTHSGDGGIVARVTAIQNTNTYAKAGVVLRETLTAGSRDVILDVKPNGGIELMTRASTGGSTSVVASASRPVPAWLRLVRTGNTVTGYVSADGVSWTTVGSTSVTMSSGAYLGMVVCSHNTGVLNTSKFDSVAVQ